MVDVRYLMVYCLTFSPAAETQLWRVADGNVFSLPWLDSVEFSVDGRTLAGASWSEEKPPGVWSTVTGKLK
jgi:hypothetical protein